MKKFKESVVNDIVIELQKRAPVDTANLRNNIIARKTGNGWEISMPYYAEFVEFGTPPHVITAKSAKALHWKSDKVNSKGNKHKTDAFAKSVNHPGTRPQPFIRYTLRNMGEIIRRNLDLLVEQ